jgi:predicted amino acid racemase
LLRGGVRQYAFSSLLAAAKAENAGIPRATRVKISLSVPAEAERVARSFVGSVHSCHETISALANGPVGLRADHEILLAVRTVEDREGLPADDAIRFARHCASFGGSSCRVVGVMANFGCRIEQAPAASELDQVRAFAAALRDVTGRRQVFSVGGSALLAHLPVAPGECDGSLRIGEAIVAGTIPGRTDSMGFGRPFSLEAKVLEVRSGAYPGQDRLLIDVGTTAFDAADVAFEDPQARVFHASGECASLDVTARSFRIGDTIQLRLGYNSAIRSLTNPSIAVKWTKDKH